VADASLFDLTRDFEVHDNLCKLGKENIQCSEMQSTLSNSRHNYEKFDISFAYILIFFTKFCGPKNSPDFFGPPCIMAASRCMICKDTTWGLSVKCAVSNVTKYMLLIFSIQWQEQFVVIEQSLSER